MSPLRSSPSLPPTSPHYQAGRCGLETPATYAQAHAGRHSAAWGATEKREMDGWLGWVRSSRREACSNEQSRLWLVGLQVEG
ncbi:unnamed protein product [Ectocarpus sp. CCAP 1310/34]|nr:unnamed protein product [Ectocarpus sp. CCAP 1310/34]